MMLNIVNYWKKVNQTNNEISPHTSQNGHHQKNPQTINAGEDVERTGSSYTVDEYVN